MTTELEVRPVYAYSVKVECNAKGWIQPTVHVYSDDIQQALHAAVRGLNCLVSDLRDNAFKVATDIKEKEV